MSLVIGVDIGTQGTKAVLVDTNKGIITQSQTSYQPMIPGPGQAEQWPDVWENAVYLVIKDLLKTIHEQKNLIKAIAVSSLYGGSGIPVNKKLEPVHPCLIWMDRRATKEVAWVKETVELDELYGITGNYVDSYYGYTKILWIKNNRPDIWKKISYFLPPNSYIIERLTGEIAIDYSSAGNIGGVFDIKKRCWSEAMLQELGIPLSMLPERIVDSSEVVGGLSRKGAANTGLQEGTPVIAGGVDAAAATLAAGVFAPGTHVAMIGTSMCWGFITESTNLSPGLISMPYVYKPEKYTYSFGGGMTSGAIINWFVEQLGEPEKSKAAEKGISVYALLEAQAEKIPPGSNGLITLPYFMGERNPIWDPDARGTLSGLSLSHTKAHLYRSFMEGIAYSLRHNMEAVNNLIPLDKDLIMVGGGANSDLLCQIFADVTGYNILTIREEVEAPIGDAFLAALGAGLAKDPAQFLTWFNLEKRALANPSVKETYDSLFPFYKETYASLKPLMKKMAEKEARGGLDVSRS